MGNFLAQISADFDDDDDDATAPSQVIQEILSPLLSHVSRFARFWDCFLLHHHHPEAPLQTVTDKHSSFASSVRLPLPYFNNKFYYVGMYVI